MIESPFLFPIAALLLSAIMLAACIWLILSRKKEVRQLHQEMASNFASPEKLAGLSAELEQMRSRLEEVEQRPSTPLEWDSDGGAVNLNRRGQVLRFYRRGDPTPQIASTLGISQGEVKLIIKLHELSRANPAEKISQNVL